MEISILLAEQILAMFLTMAVGFAVVRIGLFKTEDSRIISNMVVYICNPCVVVHAFQIELTDDKIRGLLIAIGMVCDRTYRTDRRNSCIVKSVSL